jgi:protein SCO1/2
MAVLALIVAGCALLAGAWPAAGSSAPKEIPTGSVKVTLHDLELMDQDGRKVKFESDVIGDKVAVIIPFYTTCTTAYPILIFVFTRLQVMLGERLGKEVVLISVTVDPRTDIPVRMKAFARRQKARPGWVFLTGERNNLSQVLWGTGVLFSSNLDEHDHIPITMVGSANGRWHRFHGFPTPEQMLAKVDEMAAALGHRGSVKKVSSEQSK